MTRGLVLMLVSLLSGKGWSTIEVAGADAYFALPGDSVTVSGSGLGDVTTVRFLRGAERPGNTLQVASDTSLELAFPSLNPGPGDYFLMVGSATETVVQVLPGFQALDAGGGVVAGDGMIVVNSGAVISGSNAGDLSGRIVYVKGGGTFVVPTDSGLAMLIAEDQAVVDMTGAGDFDAAMFYSPGTQVNGTLPSRPLFPPIYPPIEQVPAVRPVFGIGGFSRGVELQVAVSGQGQVSASPRQSHYRQNSVITLTATPHAGFDFVFWGGDVAGDTLVLEANLGTEGLDVTAVFTGGGLLDVTAADAHSVPVGDVITLSGAGFDGVNEVVFLRADQRSGVSFQASDETSLELTMPQLSAGDGDHALLLSSLAETAFQVLPGYLELVAGGSVGAGDGMIVVKSGAVLSGANGGDLSGRSVYVNGGGRFDVPVDSGVALVVAEDLAVVDLTGAGDFDAAMYYSPATQIVGTLPSRHPFQRLPPIEQLPSIHPIFGVPGFGLAVPLNVTVIGEGQVTVSPQQDFFRPGEMVTLTASATAGFSFIEWSGDVTSTDLVIDVTVGAGGTNLTASFTDGYELERVVGLGGTVTVDPDKALYLDDEQVTLTAVPDAGKAFHMWSGDLTGSDPSITITMDGDKTVRADFRPVAYGVPPVVAGVDMRLAPVGETVTLTGAGFSGVTGVSCWASQSIEDAVFQVVDDTTLEFTMPRMDDYRADHLVLLETAAVATVHLPAGCRELVPAGTIADGDGVIVVRSGAALSSATGIDLTSEIVYVEDGALFEVPADPNDFIGGVIVAEEGAIVDFRSTPFLLGSFVYSPGTVVLGSIPQVPLPEAIRQVSPVLPVYGFDGIGQGVRVNVTVVGGGNVTLSPALDVFRPLAEVTLTAVPESGWQFHGWTGDTSSQDPQITLTTGTSNSTDLMATFTDGFALTSYHGLGGQIIVSPDEDTYVAGAQVTLTAVPDVGNTFGGWGGDASGTDLSVVVTMNDHKIVSAAFRPDGYDQLPQLTGADHRIIPVGETIRLSGSGFADATRVSFHRSFDVHESTFQVIDDSTLDVTMVDIQGASRDRVILIETASGSTYQILPEFREYLPGGTLSSGSSPIVVRSGAVLDQASTPSVQGQTIFVESGGVLVADGGLVAVVVAEDGAILDFSGVDSLIGSVLHSPDTRLIGSMLTSGSTADRVIREIPSVRASYGQDVFQEGAAINITVVGDGQVTVTPDQPYYLASAEVTLTAFPGAGAVFTAWSGDVSEYESEITIPVTSSGRNITARFSSGYVLEGIFGSGGQVTVEPDKETYAPGESVTLTAVPDAGQVLYTWGGNVSGTAPSVEVTMDGNKTVLAAFRSATYGLLPQLTGADKHYLPVGETFTLTGSGLSGPSAVRFFWLGSGRSASFQSVDDTKLEVTMPDLHQGGRDHFLLVETAGGSTVQILPGFRELIPGGTLEAGQSPIVVRSGAALVDASGPPLLYATIYVETGAYLSAAGAGYEATIFAEDGATVDFGEGGSFSGTVFHSPQTTLLGQLPVAPPFGVAPIHQVASLRPTFGLTAFSEGCEVVLNVEGPGSASRFPRNQFVKVGTEINLTATPDAGAFFVRWIGGPSSRVPATSFTAYRNTVITARFSDRPDFFTTWREEHFTVAELSDPTISGLNANPDGDRLTNSAEYAFGLDPKVRDMVRFTLQRPADPVERNRATLTYKRPTLAADVNYILNVSSDLANWVSSADPDAWFQVGEVGASPLGDDMEEITLEISSEEDLPTSMFFTMSAEVL